MIKQQREKAANSVASKSLGGDAWDRLKRNRMAQIGGIFFLLHL